MVAQYKEKYTVSVDEDTDEVSNLLPTTVRCHPINSCSRGEDKGNQAAKCQTKR